MSESKTFHTEKFTIRANEVDTSGMLTIPSICNFFQEVAGNNARDLNFDITDMHAQNLTWVLHRMDIRLARSAKWRETITVETWPASGDSLRAYRNYRLLDEHGKEIGVCLSYWMILNLETRRPARIPDEVLNTRLDDLPNIIEVKKLRNKPIQEADSEKSIIVRRADMDMNNHVNNVRYFEWMLETIPEETTQKISSFDIVFLQETFVDDHLVSSSQTSSESVEFKITNSSGAVIAIANAELRA